MHPTIYRLGPGSCPRCGADLVERAARVPGQARRVAKRILVGGCFVLLGLAALATWKALAG
jgi:hypothetical protein